MLLSLSLKMRLFAWCFCILHSLKLSNAWDFTNLGIKNDNTSVVQHISVYYARAFICLTHSKNHNRPQRATATLVEASWPENMIGVKPVIFPNEDYFVRRATKCKGIKQAVTTDIDSSGRLWVVDNGSNLCPPKLLIFDLLYFNTEVHFQSFNGLMTKDFVKMVVDPVSSESGDTRAYLAMKSEPYLLVYSLNERKLGKLKFTNDYIQPTKAPSFSEIVITPNMETMYISDISTGNLYSLNLTPIRYLNFSMMEAKKMSMRSPLTFIGNLLGQPKSLIINSKGIMFYIVPKFSAIVTWDPRTPLTAEWHEVIYQSEINLVQLLSGKRGSVYAISSEVLKVDRHGRQKHSMKIHIE